MSQALHLQQPLPPVLRIVLGGFGAFAIVAPTWDLHRAFVPFGLASLPFAAILLGAYLVGGLLLLAAVAGEAREWRIADGLVTLTRKSLLGVRTQTIGRADLAETSIRIVEWDSRADTYSVALRLRDGTVLETPDRPTRSAAEALEGDIRRALGLA